MPSFLRSKRIKFAVELIVNRLTDVSLLNARLFAKVRLLECGSFEAVTEPKELRGHCCQLYTPEPTPTDDENVENRPSSSSRPDDLYNLVVPSKKQPFRFTCTIPYNQETLRLEECRCKISIRKVERAGKATKLGFVIINLSEFASVSGAHASPDYLLDGYPGRQRQDNSRVHIKIRMVNQMSDPLFKASFNNRRRSFSPSQSATATSLNDTLNPQDRKVPHVNATTKQKEDIKRRQQQEEGERPGSAAESNVPQSSTINSFSSSSTDNSTTPQNSTPQARYSIPGTTERRTSIPTERASWGAIDLPSSTSDYSTRLHHFSDVRRMSDDRIVVGAAQNVPNRIQQTRRDADSVIEEVLAEASVSLSDDEKSNGDPLSENKSEPATEDEDKVPAKHLELFVSRRNGDVYVGETPDQQKTPRAHFERVRADSTQ